jgi:hypothetical protein
MDQAANLDFVGLSSIGFYIFLSVWVGMTIWSRTREKLAVQETLRKLIDKGTVLTPDVIDALRRPHPKHTPAEIRASITRGRYWGWLLVVLGVALALWGWSATGDSPSVSVLTLLPILFLVIPGLFCLAQAFIKNRTQLQQARSSPNQE